MVNGALRDGDRIGYFASLYRQVTVAIRAAIRTNEFDDGERMSRFDAAFGNRYFAALDAWSHTNLLAVLIARPGGLNRSVVELIRASENRDVRQVISHLDQATPPGPDPASRSSRVVGRLDRAAAMAWCGSQRLMPTAP
jgi:hypothetical protein